MTITKPRQYPNVADPFKNMQVRVGSGDPGGQDNAFAFVLTQVDKALRKIYVIGAFGWKFQDGQIDYPKVETDLALLHKTYKLSFFVVEQNNTGLHVVQTMKRHHHIPTFAVTSANRIKSKVIIAKGETMDKKEHVGWINQQRNLGNIVFPKQKTDGIRTLLSQLDSFVRKRTPSGMVTYSAEGTEEDDFVMAFMVNTFFIRKKIWGDGVSRGHVVLTKKFPSHNPRTELGSGIPPGSILLDKEERMPIGPSVGGYRIR